MQHTQKKTKKFPPDQSNGRKELSELIYPPVNYPSKKNDATDIHQNFLQVKKLKWLHGSLQT